MFMQSLECPTIFLNILILDNNINQLSSLTASSSKICFHKALLMLFLCVWAPFNMCSMQSFTDVKHSF